MTDIVVKERPTPGTPRPYQFPPFERRQLANGLNVLVVDCVYQAALAARVPRIYLASSVHAYDFFRDYERDVDPIGPFPDVRQDAFGVPPTSLYGISKRWMEIAGQYYAEQLAPEQKILVVRLGDVSTANKPHSSELRLWDSHADLAGLFRAFFECDDAPPFYVAYGVSDNHGEAFPRPLLDPVNPYGFKPGSNAFNEPERR